MIGYRALTLTLLVFALFSGLPWWLVVVALYFPFPR